ncbi:DUF4150 domain-containing protein [Providencia sp. PROV175]|uniref:PAAR-like domain-containing protein n=1 Tax=Providencia sp. PROV175 TaxID=2949878 RepID=UPI002348F8BD|nr:PAAR-like domain-containing protein [Providencia sp. PROV175]WOB89791.1 DUF4150 domain-containing protein [Providencia sp. PROV175]
MDTRVYVNDREACSKASDGVSTAAFPDPCWSPGPSVVPYPNTSKADALSNGTATVFIQNTMVAQEDRSFFSTSTGDEPATYGLAKGVMTGVIKGKAYFRSWSLNVKFEGYGVARHQDLMTHNHGSFPSNTPTFPYVSRGVFGGLKACDKENTQVEKRCEPDKDNSEAQQTLKKESKLRKALAKKKQRQNKKNSKKWHWTDDHCAGLEIKVSGNTPEEMQEMAKEYMDDMSESIQTLKSELDYVNALKSKLTDMAENAAMKALGKVGAKAVAKQAVGSAVPAWGNAAMAIWTLGDLAYSGFEISSIKSAAEEGLEQIKVLSEKAEDIKKLMKEAESYKNLSPEEQIKRAQKLAEDTQEILASLNACARARKCNLVPYSVKNAIKGARGSKTEPANNGGCCKGQTGHHLIYSNMIKDACPNYDASIAPTVCVEGTSWHGGSHGRIHTAMDDELSRLVKNNKLDNNTLSMDQAIDAAVRSHKKTFPYANCSNHCIREQLKGYYLPMCKNARLPAKDSRGNPITVEKERER